jgi:cell division protein ZapA
MNAAPAPVTVHILERDYLVACTPEERNGLLQAAALLDERMREIRNGARTAGIDRIAVLAALNIAHELLQLRNNAQQSDGAIGDEIQALKRRLDSVAGLLPQR